MKLYKLLKTNDEYFLYDAYNNSITAIDSELYNMINEGNETKEYLDKIKKHNMRNIFNDQRIKITNCLDNYSYQWKVKNRQMMLILNLTENCNMNCTYCGYHVYNDRKRNMTKSVLEKSINQYLISSKNTEVAGISFYGGEPLIKFDLIEHAISYVNQHHKGQSVQYTVTTNGLLLDDIIIDFLIDNNFMITISLDGPKKIHDRYRVDYQGKGTYERIIKNIKRIKSKNLSFYDNNIRYNAVLAPPINPPMLNRFFDKDSVNFLELKETESFLKSYKEQEGDSSPAIDVDFNLEDSPVLLDYLRQLKNIIDS